jgi:tetratricopeptide (TPR) repeat protein
MGFLFRKQKNLPEYFFKRGEDCLNKGDLKWALESLNKAIELDPEHGMAYLLRSETLNRLGREREAAWDLVKFVEYDRRIPDNPEDLDDVIREAVKIARWDMQRKGAKDELVFYGIPKLLKEMMSGYDPRVDYKDKKFYNLALSWLRKHPEHDGHYEGFIMLIKGNLNGAINKFKETIKKNPENPHPYYFMGIALLQKSSRGRSSRLTNTLRTKASEKVFLMFKSALNQGLEGRVCLNCGYRAFSTANFCLRCGNEMLYSE